MSRALAQMLMMQGLIASVPMFSGTPHGKPARNLDRERRKSEKAAKHQARKNRK